METSKSGQRLAQCFSEVGRRYGYDSVNAEFFAFKDFKVKWQRSYKWADFKVSDYLEDAPEDVLENLAESIFARIMGEDGGYSQKLFDWVTSDEFCLTKQDLYLSRCRNLSGTVAGDSKNLRDSYERLVGAGLVNYDPSVVLSWTKDRYSSKAGHTSVLMRVVAISKCLDADEIPDFVLDYCLYHELCHLAVGFDPTGDLHAEEYRGLEEQFPEKNVAQQWLRRISVYV